MNREHFLESILALQRQGKSIRAIAEDLGVNRGRVARALTANASKPIAPSDSFIGRQQELGTVTTALDEALAGHGQIVMLAGEPGIGKTRTSQEIASIAESRGAQVLWGRCYEGQGAPPYWPWIQIIRSCIQKNEPARVRSAMARGVSNIVEIVPEVIELFPELNNSSRSEAPQAQFQLFDSISAFLKNLASDGSLVLMLDNLHSADRSSLLLLELLSQELDETKILIVGTYRAEALVRDDGLSLSLGELTKHSNFQRVNLQGLAREDMRDLLELVTGETPSDVLLKTVVTQTEGNPFFATEVVRMLAQEGMLNQVSVEGISFKVPAGVKEAISRRLHPLSEHCVQVLTVASVVGREFEIALMERLLPQIPSERVLEVLEEALSARIVEEISEVVGHYRFAHVLIQETLAQDISAFRRARLHGEIGEALEWIYAEYVESHSDELAYHFAEAESVPGNPKLVHYSLIAGERALSTYAFEEALALFQRGLNAKEGQNMDAEEAALLFGLARAQTGTLERHRIHEAAKTARPAFDYYTSIGDVPKALAIAEYSFRSLGASAEISLILAEALKLVPSDSLQAGRLLGRYGNALIMELGNFESGIEALQRSLTIAKRERNVPLERAVLNRMANAFWMARLEPQKCLEVSMRAFELDGGGQFWASIALVVLGELERARPHARAHLTMVENRGERVVVVGAIFINEAVSHLGGNWEIARGFSDRGLELDDQDVRLVANRTKLENEQGNFVEGNVYLDRLIETMQISPSGSTLENSITPLVIGLAARITGGIRHLEIAEVAANKALSVASPIIFFSQLVRMGLALIAVGRGDVKAAKEQYEALMTMQVAISPLNLICGHRVLGLLAQTMGNLDDAVVHFEESLAFCQRAGYRPELAWTNYDYAGVLLERDEPADLSMAMSLIDQALSISTELGMRPLMLQVVALQENVRLVPERTPENPASLTNREVEILRLVASGKSNAEIAGVLVISVRTVERHISNIYKKTGSTGRANATAFAFTSGLMSGHPAIT